MKKILPGVNGNRNNPNRVRINWNRIKWDADEIEGGVRADSNGGGDGKAKTQYTAFLNSVGGGEARRLTDGELAERIKSRERKRRANSLQHYRQQGADLAELKRRAGHGNWGPYCERHLYGDLGKRMIQYYLWAYAFLTIPEVAAMSDEQQWRELQRAKRGGKANTHHGAYLDSEASTWPQGTPALNAMAMLDEMMQYEKAFSELVTREVGDEKGRSGRAMPDYAAFVESDDWQSSLFSGDSDQRREKFRRFMERMARWMEAWSRSRESSKRGE
jgi:hypothetical protein